MELYVALTLVLGQARGGKIEWRQDQAQAFEDARRQRKPLIVYITDDG